MKTITLAVTAILIAGVPALASAHQHATYKIGDEMYEFVVGSLNEPIAVDDKTGVDLRVTMPGHAGMAAQGHYAAGGDVTGLESTLKVELIAGDRKKTLELSPVYNTPGSYSAQFYPTVATTLSYRFFGEINGTPVDLTFTCRAEGATAAEEGEKEISDEVMQISKSGGFGCPTPKEGMGFPEVAPALVAIDSRADRGTWGIGLSLAALALAAFALRRR